jgi:hypothetical protein
MGINGIDGDEWYPERGDEWKIPAGIRKTMAGNYRCKWEADRCIDVIKLLLGEYVYQRVLRLTVKGI